MPSTGSVALIIAEQHETEIEESFTAGAENGRLEYVMTVTDPENLAEPFTQKLTWFWNDLVLVQQYQCDTFE